VVAAATLLEEEATVSTSAAAAPALAPAPAGASKWVIDESELLTSTPEHRLWTFGPMALIGASLGVALSHVQGAGDAATAAGAVLLAFALADLGTGIYHWGVDNYGDGSTPVFGRQIAAFQGHHQRPWTITQREFCNNLHQVCGLRWAGRRRAARQHTTGFTPAAAEVPGSGLLLPREVGICFGGGSGG
jgi:hypothetical protein